VIQEFVNRKTEKNEEAGGMPASLYEPFASLCIVHLTRLPGV
jgi:hypothetical protein